MKYLRKFDSVSDMDTEIASAEIGIIGLAYDGSTPVMRIKDTQSDPKTIPFYIEDISGSENTIQIKKNKNSAPALTIEKSTDGSTWDTMGTTSLTAITATIPANGKLYLRCNTSRWGYVSDFYNNISITGNCNVGGNIMSLLYGNNFTGTETELRGDDAFNRLFYNNATLINASDLLLPATTLTSNCYYYMFYNCTSLTTAPALPATTLANSCYYDMFSWCSSLTTAPELPAPTLVDFCYYQMFQGCRNLNYIKCLGRKNIERESTTSWVSMVSSTGTFIKDPSVTNWGTGENGIPSGWTVQDATE